MRKFKTFRLTAFARTLIRGRQRMQADERLDFAFAQRRCARIDTSLPLVKELPSPRRATSVLLPPRRAPKVTVDGFRDRLGVRCCIPVAYLLHPRVLLQLSPRILVGF